MHYYNFVHIYYINIIIYIVFALLAHHTNIPNGFLIKNLLFFIGCIMEKRNIVVATTI